MKKLIGRILLAILSACVLLVMAGVAYVLVKQSANPVKSIFKPNPSAVASSLDENSRTQLDAELNKLNPSVAPGPSALQPSGTAAVEATQPFSGNVVDLLVLGVDSRQMQMESQTDMIMVIRIDKVNQAIKIISFSRDIYLKIPGYTENRINEALIYGGPELTMKTINQYFGLNIKNYVAFNFMTAEGIIDMIGKITVNVEKDELNDLNAKIKELNSLSKDKKESALIAHTGKQQLDGRQAVAYARLRPNMGSDIKRTGREREVLLSLLQQVKNIPSSRIPGLIDKSLESFCTNIPVTQYPSFAMDMYGQRNSTIEQLAIPVEGSYKQMQIVEMKYLVIDFQKNIDALNSFLKR
jgi:polyisoprenyl-teichoic acid--peptidoglycan teichoic acid transferase